MKFLSLISLAAITVTSAQNVSEAPVAAPTMMNVTMAPVMAPVMAPTMANTTMAPVSPNATEAPVMPAPVAPAPLTLSPTAEPLPTDGSSGVFSISGGLSLVVAGVGALSMV